MNAARQMAVIRALIICLGAAPLASCSESPSSDLCEERTKRCLNIDTGDVKFGDRTYFEVRLANTCRQELEYKLCFEVPDEAADCRQAYLAAIERTEERIPLSRFGGRTRVFLRYSSEAKACRFPLTRDVEF